MVTTHACPVTVESVHLPLEVNVNWMNCLLYFLWWLQYVIFTMHSDSDLVVEVAFLAVEVHDSKVIAL